MVIIQENSPGLAGEYKHLAFLLLDFHTPGVQLFPTKGEGKGTSLFKVQILCECYGGG